MSEIAPNKRVDSVVLIKHIDELDYIKNLLYALWMAIQYLSANGETALASLASLIEDRLKEALKALRDSVAERA